MSHYRKIELAVPAAVLAAKRDDEMRERHFLTGKNKIWHRKNITGPLSYWQRAALFWS